MEERIKGIMEDILDVEAGEIGDEFHRDDVDAWDSMNHLRMITALEEAFDIRFTMDEIEEIESYRDLLNAVRRYVAPA